VLGLSWQPRRTRVSPVVSCGVIVTDTTRVLLGHATRSPRWDIPKGVAEPGETHEAAARRELLEETGLAVPPGVLQSLGVHAYLPRKDLALFVWETVLPDPATLMCRSTFVIGDQILPEFDRFAVPAWVDAWGLMGKSLARVLGGVAARSGWG
jgi:8-oxo-dGTP pyrophosphatase MutT (NUDIX family)